MRYAQSYININDEIKYFWIRAHALYLVGLAGFVYYKLPKPNETVMGNHCQIHFMYLS